ncbi:polysaccharide deacetylase family protein [Paenibacillus montanisoli]|uniref:Polysaccharide deacetylase n=1 Tax=Paenibacillus montanisoli TaxID=2081970 RepID=A0A328U2C8_9BACL|nr:polysaccharide deacetylase family protein [Paenibacillus montanisoli]RAP75923.1 polysaccharide deacetylase [Paenibacillus montanisoli]
MRPLWRRLLLLGMVLLVILLLLFGLQWLMNARSFQLFGGITNHVETGDKVVALTFDDGPSGNVEPILQLLSKYDAKATFFVIGSELKSRMEEGRMIVRAGHQLGNHSYSHERILFKSRAYVEREVEQTNDLIREAGYLGEIDFRPPYGKKIYSLPHYLHEQGIQTIMWDLEPDTFYATAQEKIKAAVEGAHPGSIILLHPMYDKTGQELQVIEGILDGLTRQGYRFLTVNELQKQ